MRKTGRRRQDTEEGGKDYQMRRFKKLRAAPHSQKREKYEERESGFSRTIQPHTRLTMN